MDAQVLSPAGPCTICDGQSGTGSDLSLNTSVFPCKYNSTLAYQSIFHSLNTDAI
jgi:hypothetical protein